MLQVKRDCERPVFQTANSLRVRVLLVEERPLVAVGVRASLAETQDIELVGIVAGSRAEIEVRRLRPDIMVIDPVSEAFSPDNVWQPRLVALSAYEDPRYMKSLLQCGVAGYVCLRAPAAEIVQAIRVVAEGRLFVDSVMSTKQSSPLPVEELSGRELAVIKLVARGLTDKEIAQRLGIGIKTVSSYKQRAAANLGVRRRAEIVELAINHNWLI